MYCCLQDGPCCSSASSFRSGSRQRLQCDAGQVMGGSGYCSWARVPSTGENWQQKILDGRHNGKLSAAAVTKIWGRFAHCMTALNFDASRVLCIRLGFYIHPMSPWSKQTTHNLPSLVRTTAVRRSQLVQSELATRWSFEINVIGSRLLPILVGNHAETQTR
jgi:hypothetical protein